MANFTQMKITSICTIVYTLKEKYIPAQIVFVNSEIAIESFIDDITNVMFNKLSTLKNKQTKQYVVVI